MDDERISIAEVNGMGFAEFTRVFAAIVEYTPLVAAIVWSSRPFADLASLNAAFTGFIRALSAEAQAGVLRCYPDLVAKIDILYRGVSAVSQKEQKFAGLHQLSEEERRELIHLNNCYKEKFSFPFVLCTRDNRKEAIIKALRARMGNERAVEIRNAIDEICKIVLYRLQSIVKESSNCCVHKL